MHPLFNKVQFEIFFKNEVKYAVFLNDYVSI